MATTNPLSPRIERRAFRRIAVRLPVIVRTDAPDGATLEESTHSLNISRMGAAFAARLPLEVGRVVEVTIPAPGPRREAARDFFARARVVRVDVAPPVTLTPTTAETFEAALSAGPATSTSFAPNPPRVSSTPSAAAVAPALIPVPAPTPAPPPSPSSTSIPSTRLIAVEFLGQQYPHVFVSESST